MPVSGLVDSGSSCTLVTEQLARQLKLKPRSTDAIISSVCGDRIQHVGQVTCDLVVQEHRLAAWKALVIPRLPGDASVLIGMDVISKVGGMALSILESGQAVAQFGQQQSGVAAAVGVLRAVKPSVVLEDVDFEAEFDG